MKEKNRTFEDRSVNSMEAAARIVYQLRIQVTQKLNALLSEFNHPCWHEEFLSQIFTKSFQFLNGIIDEDERMKFDLSFTINLLLSNLQKV